MLATTQRDLHGNMAILKGLQFGVSHHKVGEMKSQRMEEFAVHGNVKASVL